MAKDSRTSNRKSRRSCQYAEPKCLQTLPTLKLEGRFGEKYELAERNGVLGHGSITTTFLTYHKRSTNTLATKLSDRSQHRSANVDLRFESEVKTLLYIQSHSRQSRDNHRFTDSIVQLRNYFQDRYNNYSVFEYCEEGDLSMHLKAYENRNGISVTKVRPIAHGILSGLNFLHSIGVVHRDLKCSNVLVTKSGNTRLYKIADFDLSYVDPAVGSSGGDIHMNEIVGTLEYMAPEIASHLYHGISGGEIGLELDDMPDYTQTVDLWSFGVLLYNLISNSLPFTNLGSECGDCELWDTGTDCEYCDVQVLQNIIYQAPEFPKHRERRSAWSKDSARQAIDFIKKCFVLEGSLRWDAKEALEHVFFQPPRASPPRLLKSHSEPGQLLSLKSLSFSGSISRVVKEITQK